MSARSEYDAAYFTLLRAREEHEALLRYRDYLERETRRLDEFTAATRDLADQVPPKVRKPVDLTTKTMLEGVGRRRSVVSSELNHVDDRIADAQAFVEECEEDLASLRP